MFRSSRRPQPERRGIGLSSVVRIVRVYNTSIVAFNDDGACFEFVLYDYR